MGFAAAKATALGLTGRYKEKNMDDVLNLQRLPGSAEHEEPFGSGISGTCSSQSSGPGPSSCSKNCKSEVDDLEW